MAFAAFAEDGDKLRSFIRLLLIRDSMSIEDGNIEFTPISSMSLFAYYTIYTYVILKWTLPES